MTSIIELIQNHRADLGRKPEAVASGRLAEARRLTGLLNTNQGFSFGRIGDYDVGLLLQPKEASAFYNAAHHKVSGTQAGGSPGLAADQTVRLRQALERVSYLDYHERLWKDTTLLDQLQLQRSPQAERNPSRETSYILPTWLEHEFKNYCRGRRVLFCGAEVSLLENLLKRETFRECAGHFWPENCKTFFMSPREDGRNLDANLDLIKADLRDAIAHHRIDTLFLSLGGGAKILCSELAGELGIKAIDFGAGLRSLTYSGSDGNLAVRSTHLVFLYRIPFGLYLDALAQTYPDLSVEILLAKAHAQLLLEVQEKEIGWSHSAWELDFSPENIFHFHESYLVYRQRYQCLFGYSDTTRKERADFQHFCGAHKLTMEGRYFLAKFWLKSAIARMIKL